MRKLLITIIKCLLPLELSFSLFLHSMQKTPTIISDVQNRLDQSVALQAVQTPLPEGIMSSLLQTTHPDIYKWIKKICLAPQIILTGHTNPIRAIAWSPDNIHLASLDKSSIFIWNTVQQKCIHRIDFTDGNGLSWSPDGNYLAASAANYSTIWETKHWNNLTTITNCTQPAWNYDGKYLAGKESRNTLCIYDVKNTKIIPGAVVVLGEDSIENFAWNPINNHIAITHKGICNFIDCTDIVNGKKQALAVSSDDGTKLKDFINSVAWHPDGKLVALSTLFDIVFIDESTKQQKNIIGIPTFSGHTSLSWHPSGLFLATYGRNQNAAIMIIKGATPTTRIEIPEKWGCAKWRPDGMHLAAAHEAQVHLWPTASIINTDQFLEQLSLKQATYLIDLYAMVQKDLRAVIPFNRPDLLLVFQSLPPAIQQALLKSQTVRLQKPEERINLPPGQEIHIQEAYQKKALASVFPEIHTWLYRLNLQQRAKNPIKLACCGTNTMTIAFSNSGRYLAAVSFDGDIHTYDILTGECLQAKLDESTKPSRTLIAWSPDDTYIAIAFEHNNQTVVKLYAAQSLKKEEKEQKSAGALKSISWNSDVEMHILTIIKKGLRANRMQSFEHSYTWNWPSNIVSAPIEKLTESYSSEPYTKEYWSHNKHYFVLYHENAPYIDIFSEHKEKARYNILNLPFDGKLHDVAWNSDDNSFAIGTDNGVTMWNIALAQLDKAINSLSKDQISLLVWLYTKRNDRPITLLRASDLHHIFDSLPPLLKRLLIANRFIEIIDPQKALQLRKGNQ